MKREGRQHGMVRTYRILPSPWNPRPGSRSVNRLDSIPTAGLFTKVPPKPTNHSKFTSKCGKPRCIDCHKHPACKSKDKAKGTKKMRSFDVASNQQLITWRVVDGRAGLNLSGFSASGLVDHLASAYVEDDEDHMSEYESEHGHVEEGVYDDIERSYGEEENKDDHVNLCDMDLMLNQVDEEDDWCLVE